jgi:hypothetical protein
VYYSCICTIHWNVYSVLSGSVMETRKSIALEDFDKMLLCLYRRYFSWSLICRVTCTISTEAQGKLGFSQSYLNNVSIYDTLHVPTCNHGASFDCGFS